MPQEDTMNDHRIEDGEWEEESSGPSPWRDVTEFSPKASGDGPGFWDGVEGCWEMGPLRGWKIRRLYAASRLYAPKAHQDFWARMVQWFLEGDEASEYGYVRFRTPEVYVPGSPGLWVLNDEAIKEDLPKAFAWATQCAYESVDDLLADPLQNIETAVQEPCVVDLIPAEARKKFFASRNRIQRHWPRLCSECGEGFRPRTRNNVRRCQSCIMRRAAVRGS
jgi:hypothetical protein